MYEMITPARINRHIHKTPTRSPERTGRVHGSLGYLRRRLSVRSIGGRMADSEKMPRRSGKRIRCAIYTRKSTDEGLEQALHSLDAQRESCAAFMLSQKH